MPFWKKGNQCLKEDKRYLARKYDILVGQCQVKLNNDHSAINHCCKIRGCPPKKDEFVQAFKEAGIEFADNFMEWIMRSPELVYIKRAEGNQIFNPTYNSVNLKRINSRLI